VTSITALAPGLPTSSSSRNKTAVSSASLLVCVLYFLVWRCGIIKLHVANALYKINADYTIANNPRGYSNLYTLVAILGEV
jgi:hypothetical protein